MSDPAPSLYLVTPVLDDAAAFVPPLEAACRSGRVAAVLLRLAPADERTLVNRVKAIAPAAQAHGAAVLVADPDSAIDLAAVVMRGGADGGHAASPDRIEMLCRRLKDGRAVGAGGLRTKHDAMVAGEMGVDYVLFGEPEAGGASPALGLVEERARWWAEIFQTPCVAYAPSFAAIPRLAATGTEFVALCDAVWTHPDGPEFALAQAARLLTPAPENAA